MATITYGEPLRLGVLGAAAFALVAFVCAALAAQHAAAYAAVSALDGLALASWCGTAAPTTAGATAHCVWCYLALVFAGAAFWSGTSARGSRV